jgi:alanyl-tRNA synthetase
VHESTGAVETLLALGECDGDGFVAATGESSYGRREIFRLVGLLSEREGRGCRGCGGGGEKEAASIEFCVGLYLIHGCGDCSGLRVGESIEIKWMGSLSGKVLSLEERLCLIEIGRRRRGLREFSGVVTDIREESRVLGKQRWQMALDRTEFVVGDVGVLEAVARSGVRLSVPVLGVVVDTGGEVWHVVEKPLAAGTVVTGRVG